jgi:Icc protein
MSSNCTWIEGVQSKPLKVLQVSDCHVSADPEAVYRTRNADRNVRSLLPAMRAWNPDVILLTGDVSEDASPAAYSRVADMLGEIDAPLLALPGNHDDPRIMQNHFRQGPWDGPFVQEAGSWLLALMDSTVRGRVSGCIQQQDLDRLDAQLDASSADFVLVALHHQPVPVNAPWIDRYALENPDVFFKGLDRDLRIRCITWGHIHHDFRSKRKGADLLGAPSAAANSLPETERFTLDPAGPACRWLELHEDGRVETGLLGV